MHLAVCVTCGELVHLKLGSLHGVLWIIGIRSVDVTQTLGLALQVSLFVKDVELIFLHCVILLELLTGQLAIKIVNSSLLLVISVRLKHGIITLGNGHELLSCAILILSLLLLENLMRILHLLLILAIFWSIVANYVGIIELIPRILL